MSDLRYFLGWFNEYVKSQRSIGSNPTNETDIFILLDTEAILSFKHYLKTENKLPDKSINRRLSTVRKFCTFAIQQGWLKENPAKKVANLTQSTLSTESVREFEQQMGHELTQQTKEDISEFLSIIN